MTTRKLTIRLPDEDVEYAKAYAKTHGLSVTQLLNRYLRRMRAFDEQQPHPELDIITGLVPANVNVKNILRDHMQDKHSQ